MQKRRIVTVIVFSIFLLALLFPLLKQQDYGVSDDAEIKADTVASQKPEIELPLHKVSLPDFGKISDVRTKKKQFFAFLTPAILAENRRILTLRTQLESIVNKIVNDQPLSADEGQVFSQLVNQYRVNKKLKPLDKLALLKQRVDIVPMELVLVQAANESAWGTSRFARIGLNFFGIWCYKKGCGMVPNGRDHGLKHEVAAFESVEQAVRHYLHNINTNSAYQVFRTIRSQLHQQNRPLSAEILATGLLPYSERGTDYVLEITDMIRHNQAYFDSSLSD